MMGTVVNGVRRASIPPSANVLNKLNLALEKALDNDVVNGTSTAVVSSFTGSQVESATVSVSKSAASLVQSAASAVSDVSSGFSSALPESASTSATASATSAVPPSASEKLTSAPQLASSLVSSSQRSASNPEPSLTVPKNAAAVSTSLAASSTSSAVPATSRSASPQTNNASSTEPTSVRTDTPQTRSSSAPEATSQTPATSPQTPTTSPQTSATSSQAPATSRASSTSSAVISTQHAQISTSQASESSSTTAQTPTSSSSRVAEQQPASAASSPQSSNSPSPSVARVQNSAADANSRGSQSPSTASLTDNLGNSLVGLTSASSSVHADTTLSTPEAVTITSGSSTFTTTPAFFTSISVSSGKNGSPLQTFTSIIANPTGLPTSAGLSNWTIWDNKGAVAGIFTVVALAVLGAILSTFYCLRRRRRRMERGVFANSQFQRFSGIQDMSQQPTTYQAVQGHNYNSSYKDDPSRYLMAPSLTSGLSHGHEDQTNVQRSASQNSHRSSNLHTGALGLTGVFGSYSGNVETYDGPFSDIIRSSSADDSRLGGPPGEPVGIAFSSDYATKAKPTDETQPERAPDHRPPSPAPSTPSIYPPSLAPVPEKDEDNYLFYERETQRRPESKLLTPPPRAVVNDSDSNLQNPFASPLDPVYVAAQRQSMPSVRVLTNQAYRPLTPPDSSSGSSPTTPQVPAESVKPLNINPYTNAFLGRSMSLRNDPLPRPKRNPLRTLANETSLKDGKLP